MFRMPPDEQCAMQLAAAPLTMNVMSTPIAKNEAVSLLRKAQEETAPVELVGTGEGQQALHVLGFVDVEDGGEAFSIYVPGQIAVVFQLHDAKFEYGEPREAPPQHRARAQKASTIRAWPEKKGMDSDDPRLEAPG